MLNAQSLKHLNEEGLHGDLRAVVLRAAEILPTISDDITFQVEDGLRTLKEQKENVKKGVSKTLKSRHLTGHAVDLKTYKNGKLVWEFPDAQHVEIFIPAANAMKLAAADLGVPLEWGYDLWGWDAPHFQLSKADYPEGAEVSFLDNGRPFQAERFAVCVAKTLATEELWNPDDPSMRGITLPALRRWDPDATINDLKKLDEATARLIYRANYWHPAGCDDCPPGLDYAVFDFAVHSGPREAVQQLQGIVGTGVDGIFGPLTRAAVKKADTEKTINTLMDRRFAYMKTRPNWAKNANGWTKRIKEVRADAIAMAREPAPDIERPNAPKALADYGTSDLYTELLRRPEVAQVILQAPAN